MVLNIFKSKPTLNELIPNGFVDIHSHILPGIDDGAKNINQSLKLISNMKKVGFTKIYGTPHVYPGVYNNDDDDIKKSYKSLEKYLKNDVIDVKYASEYMLDDTLLRKIDNKSLLTINNNYVLIELGFISPPPNLDEIIFRLILNGYIPVIAHPERYLYFDNNFNKFYNLKKNGCKFQLNLLSLTGYYGKIVLKMSKKLIEDKIIDYVASDIHNNEHIIEFEKKIKIKNVEEIEKIVENTKISFS